MMVRGLIERQAAARYALTEQGRAVLSPMPREGDNGAPGRRLLGPQPRLHPPPLEDAKAAFRAYERWQREQRG
jgi:hypothetical protein